MSRSLHLRSMLGGVLALAGCADTATQPETGGELKPSAQLALLVSNTWTTRSAAPGALVGRSAGMVPNSSGQSIVYTFGGTDNEGLAGVSISAYNVATNTWTSKGFEPRVPVFNTNGVGRIGNTLYFSGGRDYNNGYDAIVSGFWAYNAATNTLTQKASMPKATAEGVTGVIDGKLYVLPGMCSFDNYPAPGYCETEPFRRLFRYNPVTNNWATKRPARHYHRHGAGGVINGKFYVAGESTTFRGLWLPSNGTIRRPTRGRRWPRCRLQGQLVALSSKASSSS